MGNFLQQSSEQQQEGVHYNLGIWDDNRSVNEMLKRKPNFIKLLKNGYLENYNTKRYSNFSYTSFLEAMEKVKTNRIENYPENFYKIMGIPAPDQYRAFIELYKLVGNDDFFAKHPKTFSNHACLPRYPGTLKLLRDIYINYNKDPVKNIIISCGSFYRKYLWVRTEIIDYLNQLCEKGVKIELYTNCKTDEDEINKLSKKIRFESLENRIMIHFVLVDDKKIKIHYPHSEKIYHRLGMLLTPADFNNELLEKRIALFQFFINLIAEAKK